MFDRYFPRIYDLTKRRKWLVVGLAAAVVAASVVGLRFVVFDNNIESMLPGNAEVFRAMRFLQESNLSDKVVISLKLKSSEHTTQDLIAAAERLERSLEPPLVKEVVSGVAGANVGEDVLAFMRYAPQLIDEDGLSRIDRQITPAGVQERLREIYRQLLTPGSTFIMPFIRSDPLGLSSGILKALQRIPALLGYEVQILDGHFISKDGRHTMLLLKTPVILTDGFGSRELITYLREKLKSLPDHISADIIAGHLHSISNEDVIKKDIQLTSVIASAGFLLLFFLVFRDARAIMIFIMPLLSVLVSINLSFVVLHKLSYFIIGLGTVIAGISIDYGIFVYLAVRGSGRSDIVKQIAKPVLVGALTTISIFGAFFFSSVNGYKQLALFSSFSIILCLAYALLILPHFLDGERQGGVSSVVGRSVELRKPALDGVRVACWLGVMILAGIAASQANFDRDISQFDGSERQVVKAEQDFYDVWGGRQKPAVFVIPGENLEEVLQRGERVYEEAVAAVGEDSFSSLTALWPSRATREANAARWEQFWRNGREAALRRYLQEYGRMYHFSDDAFSPFFEQLYAGTVVENEPKGVSFFESLEEQFILKKRNEYQLLSFFPDEEQHNKAMAAISKRYPGTFAVSQNSFSLAISRAVASELMFLAGLAVLLIVVFTRVLLQDTLLTLLVMVPVITGMVMIPAVTALLGLSLNTPGLVAAMVVVGIVSDYGIFLVYAYRYDVKAGAHLSVSLAALTTLIGAGVLIFARHPVMFSIGITLVTGVLSGYISALAVIPALYRLWFQREGKPV